MRAARHHHVSECAGGVQGDDFLSGKIPNLTQDASQSALWDLQTSISSERPFNLIKKSAMDSPAACLQLGNARRRSASLLESLACFWRMSSTASTKELESGALVMCAPALSGSPAINTSFARSVAWGQTGLLSPSSSRNPFTIVITLKFWKVTSGETEGRV